MCGFLKLTKKLLVDHTFSVIHHSKCHRLPGPCNNPLGLALWFLNSGGHSATSMLISSQIFCCIVDLRHWCTLFVVEIKSSLWFFWQICISYFSCQKLFNEIYYMSVSQFFIEMFIKMLENTWKKILEFTSFVNFVFFASCVIKGIPSLKYLPCRNGGILQFLR